MSIDEAALKAVLSPQWGYGYDGAKALIEAYEAAKASGQIRQKTGNPDSKELFSEDLY